MTTAAMPAAPALSDEAALQQILTKARVSEPVAEHRITVILICGFMEADPTRLIRWFQRLSEHGLNLETVRLVGLSAPKRPITCYDGWQTPGWFDYITETYDTEDVIDESQLAQSRRLLTQIVDVEVARLGGSPDRLVLLGYSQGGNMAYDVALSYRAQLGGLIARRTSLRNESQLGPHHTLPITHFHGEEDDGIGCNRGKAGIARLQAAGFTNVELNTQPDLNHVDFSTDEMEIYAAFLASLFPSLSASVGTEEVAESHHRSFALRSRHLVGPRVVGLSRDSRLKGPNTGRRKSSAYRWLLGLVGVRHFIAALRDFFLVCFRILSRRKQTPSTGSTMSDPSGNDVVPTVSSGVSRGFQLPGTADIRSQLDGSRSMTPEGMGWANAAAADMAKRRARSVPPFQLKGKNSTSQEESEGMDGNYTDPNHPNGFRMLKLSADGASAIIVGNDDTKTGVSFTLHGRIRGNSIEIDFTPKARRVGKLVGVWDGSGIVFADGNRWAKVPGLNEAFVLF